MSFIIKLIVVLVSVFVFLKLVALYTNSSKKIAKKSSKARLLVAGFLANFADTLGLGSFAVVVAFNNRWNLVEDKKLPGTLNAHCVLPAMLQSLLFLNFVEMDIFLLITFVLAVCGGGLLSGFLVAKLETQTIRFLMCIGFVGIGILIIASQLHLLPVGGEATFLPMEKLIVGIFAMIFAGMLPAIGVGIYVPIQVILFFLGLSPLVAFPIMTTAGAIVHSVTSYAFVSKKKVAAEESLWLAISGLVGVALAVPMITYVNLSTLRWLLLFIVFYNAAMLWMAYQKEREELVKA